jgi:hypothetical protein
VARPLTRHGVTRRWKAATLRHGPAPAYLGEFIGLVARAAMPVNGHGKPAGAAAAR